METEATLKEFNEHLEAYGTHRSYIDRARAHAHKFTSSVVEKVILDHEIKSTEVAELIMPLVPQLQGALAELDGQRQQINEKKAGSEEQMEELTLRKEIGELTDEDFEQLTAELKAGLEEAGQRVGEIDAEHGTLEEALQKWFELAAGADQATGAAEPEIDLDPELPIVDDEVRIDDDEGIHVSTSGSVEDVSAAFGDEPVEVEAEGADVVELEAAEGHVDEESAEIDLGFGDEGGEVELALVGDGSAEAEGAEIDISPAEEGVDNRRALLLYQEGTPEEQIYPFTGEVITIGRGRDNDIQIKNDSKVSRYHCKVYRRGANFYIEDNKSSNGSLVNGELITERRLFGGEEIIIGETFFRFRIME